MEHDEGNEPVPERGQQAPRAIRVLLMAQQLAVVLEHIAQAASSEVLATIARTSVVALGLAVNFFGQRRR
ncbi:hypothetical protein [Allokutzneria sp. NRRL B-24872]|uniref:hypothetical protein n=1 Tax=Allokutzneria sp. NRRL B-24872 TaxID=1137961 RepID=UPI000A3C9645|nr:hypothetical protein [Allokutzneria sp. NRRL B-24872]